MGERQEWGTKAEHLYLMNMLPSENGLLWPTLKAIEGLGGSASIEELSDRIAIDLGLTDEMMDVPHGDGLQSEVDYRAAWARTRLRWVGAVENRSRGVWAITEAGRGFESAKAVQAEIRRALQRRRTKRQVVAEDVTNELGDSNEARTWRDGVLHALANMAPDAFERLCQRLLREHGFTRVEVTGRSGDGGIDGSGVLRVNLVSFHVIYQCKRYAGSVGSSAIRDFRGAMVGRADKALFITTGRFTKDAEREAVRDGAPPIDLIDGVELCALLKEKELGMTTRSVEEVVLNLDFFRQL